MSELRLGDIIDDYCIKCRRMTNHAIVSIVETQVAKVRCRSCYHDHDYLHEVVPPSKKDLKKAELAAAAKAGEQPSDEPELEPELLEELTLEDDLLEDQEISLQIETESATPKSKKA